MSNRSSRTLSGAGWRWARTIGRSWARGPADDTFPDGLDPALNDQLEGTRKLQAEGLEGLPRAGQLLALGSTFWLGLCTLPRACPHLAGRTPFLARRP